MSKSVLETYDPKEELFNAYSHGAGVVMAVVASVFLIIKGSYLSTAQWVGLWVYAFSLILVFTSSTLYHFAQTQNLRYSQTTLLFIQDSKKTRNNSSTESINHSLRLRLTHAHICSIGFKSGLYAGSQRILCPCCSNNS